MSSPFAFLGDTYNTKEGTKPISTLDSMPAVAVYFSAHWCPPCRNFTPILSEFYNEVNANGKKLEIIFVSLDQDQNAFNDYWGTMSFAAANYDKAKVQSIQAKIPFSGIPYLVVLNKDGSVKSTNGRNDVSNEGPSCVANWINK